MQDRICMNNVRQISITIKSKTFNVSKDTIKKMKRQGTHRDEILVNTQVIKDFTMIIYSSSTTQSEKASIPFKNWQNIYTDTSLKQRYAQENEHMERSSTQHGNATQKEDDQLSHRLKWGNPKNMARKIWSNENPQTLLLGV